MLEVNILSAVEDTGFFYIICHNFRSFAEAKQKQISNCCSDFMLCNPPSYGDFHATFLIGHRYGMKGHLKRAI